MLENSILLDSLFRQANELYEKGDLSTSYKLLNKILLINSEHIQSIKYIALIYKAWNNYSQAIFYLKKLINYQEQAEIYYLLGLCYLYTDEINLAINNLKLSLKIDSDYFISYANLASCYQINGDFKKAVENYEKYLEYDPDNSEINNNIGLIYESLSDNKKAEEYYRKAIELDNSEFKPFINLALILQKQMKIHESTMMFLQAIKLNPFEADFYNNLAVNYQYQNNYNSAIEYYRKAIELNNSNPDFYNNLATAYELIENFEQAIKNYLIAIDLSPENQKFKYNLGVCYEKLKLYDEAIFMYRLAIKIEPEFADAHLNLGILLLLKESFTEGWQEYEWRIIKDNYYFDKDKPVWKGESLENKKLLIRCEQGAGDSIQFSRYLNLLKAENTEIILQCDNSLVELLNNSFSVECISDKITYKEYDYQIYLMSLPYLLKTHLKTIPAITPYIFFKNTLNSGDDKNIINLLNKLNKVKKPKIGIVWSGNPLHKNNENRSCDIKYFYELAKKLDLIFFSLQKDLTDIGANYSNRIVSLSEFIKDYNDTAFIIDKLDLVISVDTSVAHLSGSMNKNTYLLLGDKGDWRWAEAGNRSNWYSSIKIFRQSRKKNWDYIFNNLYRELSKII